MHTTRILAVAVIGVWSLGNWWEVPLHAQDHTVEVTRITEAITVDGALDEAAWASAPKIVNLTQRQPEPGTAPSEQTEVTLLRDADNLYIGIVAHDSEPDKVIGTQMARDGSLMSD